MRTFTPAIIGSVVAVAALNGCSNQQTSIPELQNATTVRSAGYAQVKPRSLVYVSDGTRNLVAVFDRDGRQVGTITKDLSGPRGIFVDANHNLWIANQGPSNVLMFARGATSPSAILRDASNAPDDVTVCPDGSVYVANVINGIAVYTGPKHHFARSMNFDAAQFAFVTCDAAGNVFATGVVGTFGTVIEFPGGHKSGAHLLPISSPGNLGGIKPDNAGRLLVVFGDAVLEYTEAGAPTGVQIQEGLGPDIALDRAGKTLLAGNQSANDAVSVTFPGGKPGVAYKDDFSQVFGVAIDPEL